MWLFPYLVLFCAFRRFCLQVFREFDPTDSGIVTSQVLRHVLTEVDVDTCLAPQEVCRPTIATCTSIPIRICVRICLHCMCMCMATCVLCLLCLCAHFNVHIFARILLRHGVYEHMNVGVVCACECSSRRLCNTFGLYSADRRLVSLEQHFQKR
jgi:hypothetical protein